MKSLFLLCGQRSSLYTFGWVYCAVSDIIQQTIEIHENTLGQLRFTAKNCIVSIELICDAILGLPSVKNRVKFVNT